MVQICRLHSYVPEQLKEFHNVHKCITPSVLSSKNFYEELLDIFMLNQKHCSLTWICRIRTIETLKCLFFLDLSLKVCVTDYLRKLRWCLKEFYKQQVSYLFILSKLEFIVKTVFIKD